MKLLHDVKWGVILPPPHKHQTPAAVSLISRKRGKSSGSIVHEEKSNIGFNIRKNRFHLMLKYIQCMRACKTAVIHRTHVYLSASSMHYCRLAQPQRIRFLSYSVNLLSPAHKICTPFLCSTLLSKCFVVKVIMYMYVRMTCYNDELKSVFYT